MLAVRLNAAGSILPSGVVGRGGPQMSLLISAIIQVWCRRPSAGLSLRTMSTHSAGLSRQNSQPLSEARTKRAFDVPVLGRLQVVGLDEDPVLEHRRAFLVEVDDDEVLRLHARVQDLLVQEVH